MKPLVAIAGATSKQGRSVATTLLQRGQYRVRALTRNPAAPQAQALARLGAEVVATPLAVMMPPGAPPFAGRTAPSS